MQIIHQSSELQTRGRKVCAAIGVFDGVHLGHQQVIRRTITDAEQQEALALLQWRSLIVWQCELKQPEKLAEKLNRFLAAESPAL